MLRYNPKTTQTFRVRKDIPPELMQRARNLLYRGFDVPPSKQADWETLRSNQYTIQQCKEALKLE